MRFIGNHNTAWFGSSAGFQRRDAQEAIYELLTTPAGKQFLRRAAASGIFLSALYGHRVFPWTFLLC